MTGRRRPAAGEDGATRVWDSVADVQMIGRFGNTFAELHNISRDRPFGDYGERPRA